MLKAMPIMRNVGLAVKTIVSEVPLAQIGDFMLEQPGDFGEVCFSWQPSRTDCVHFIIKLCVFHKINCFILK